MPGWGADAATSKGDPARYLGEGGNFIDTASRYMEDASESVIGKYLAKNPGVRDRLVIASKFALTLDPADPHNGGTSRKAVSAPRADAYPSAPGWRLAFCRLRSRN